MPKTWSQATQRRFSNLCIVLFVTLIAAPAQAGMFAPFGRFLWDIVKDVSDDLGVPITILGVIWCIIAYLCRVGGLILAIPTTLAGFALINIEAIGRAVFKQ